MKTIKIKNKLQIELSSSEAENLFCFLQMAEVVICEEHQKYLAIAEKLRFSLEEKLNDE